MSPLLTVNGIEVRYGRASALRNVTLTVDEGELVGVLGRNGAGKTTLLRAVSGFARPHAGAVFLQDTQLAGCAPHQVARLGVAYVPDDRGLFRQLTVWENLRLAIRDDRSRKRLDGILQLFPVLSERASSLAGTLSGGEQQMLALGRALVAGPRLLLLDEPSLGLAPRLMDALFTTLKELTGQGMGILLVEQNIDAALSVCDRAVVLALGEVVAEGTPSELQGSILLRRAFLGEGPHSSPPTREVET